MESITLNASVDSQTFKTTINSEVFYFKVVWKELLACWSLTLYNSDKDVLLRGLNLKSGVELINHYNLSIRNLYLINTAYPTLDVTREDVGNYFLMVFTDEEIESAEPEVVASIDYNIEDIIEQTIWSDPEFESHYVGQDINALFYALYQIVNNLPDA